MAVCLSLLGFALLPGHPASADLSTDLIVQGFAAPWGDSYGAAHVMGEVEVRNTATSNYRDLVVSCTLVDATGATQTQTADVQATILTPGEKAPFDAVFPSIGTGFTQPACTMFGGATTTAYNVGVGRGFSVREVLDTVERVTGRTLNRVLAPRRAGDPSALVADATRIGSDLGWKPAYPELEAIVETAWRWHSTHPAGFGD